MRSFVTLALMLNALLVSLPLSVQSSRSEKAVPRHFEAQRLPAAHHTELLIRRHRRLVKDERSVDTDEDGQVIAPQKLESGGELGKRSGSRFTLFSPGL